MMNKTYYETFETVLETGNVALSPEQFEAIANNEDALVLDVRPQSDFIKGHIPNSIFIGLNGGFAPWVGALITDLKQPILLIVPEGKANEAVTRLSRVGYDNTLGYLENGIEGWKASGRDIETLESISAEEFANRMTSSNINVLDVRKDGEYSAMHIEGDNIKHFALDFINDNMNAINSGTEYYIHCAGGYRSVIAASILKARGFNNLIDVAGGFGAIKKTNLPLTNFVCPSTL